MSSRHLILAAMAAAAGAPLAHAQQTDILEEVIVTTARARAEAVIDVPVTVRAFSETEIRNAGIERPGDFVALTPGVSQVQTAEIGDLQLNIRGINTGRDSEPNYALVIDGILQTNPAALNQELNAVTQIEVVKGPQGAVYGRNAVAGAVIITTRKPTDELQVFAGGGVGSDSSYKANLWVGAPLGDSAKGALSGYYRTTDGQWTNSYIGCDDCADYYEETGFTGRLLFEGLGGDFDFRAKYSTIEAGAINFNASLALSDAAQGLGVPIFWEDANQHQFEYINNIRPENEQENVNLSLKGDWDVGANTLTAWVAYNKQDNEFLTDGTSAAFNLYSTVDSCIDSNDELTDTFPLPPPFFYGNPSGSFVTSFLPPYSPVLCDGYQYQVRDQEDYSAEIRLSSPGDQRMRWSAGAYFANIERNVVVAQGSDNGDGFVKAPFVPTSGPNPTDLLYDDDFTSDVWAVFGQLAYDITDGLEVSLALRYDEEKREVSNNVPTGANAFAQTPGFGAAFSGGGQPYINPAYTQNPALATSGIPGRSRTYSELQPKLSVNWKLNEGFAVYGSYGVGFRSGGFNSTGSAATVEQWYGNLCLGPSFTTPVCDANSVYNISNVGDDYDKEVSKAAEVGFKSELMDRALSINGAIFYTEVEDMLFFNFFAGPFGLLRVVTNIDEVEIKGAEIDFRWQANDWLALFGGYSYLDAEIKRYDGRPYTVGNHVPYAPDYTGNVGTEMTFPLGSQGYQLLARVDASFVGETWFHPVQDNRLPNLFTGFGFGQGEFSKQKRDAYSVLNARLTLQKDNWGVTAWGRNLTDEEYLAEVIPAPEFGGSFIHNGQGSAYGLDVNFRF